MKAIFHHCAVLGILVLARFSGLPHAEASAQIGPIDFERDIRPILVESCLECHGPKEARNGLRLDSRKWMLQGGDSGPAITAGKSESSLLMHFVTGRNEKKLVMPYKREALKEKQILLLSAWIDQGAPWPESATALATPLVSSEHWSFKPLRRPVVPVAQNDNWPRNQVDAFILNHLKKEGVRPSPEADKAVLFRRLSIDLLGLPPDPAELRNFLNDPNPDAYGKAVERMLESPRFGERWARFWLDLARYADSDGYEDDKFRPDAWRYRDWVVSAFNRDLPYDQFTLWQIAGDLIPQATPEQRIATGFHRMTLSNNAGAGGIKEEYRVKAVKDRLTTTATAWLGLTVGCAECHSHKYDPISNREYYQLYAFFDSTEEVSLPAPAPGVRYLAEFQESLGQFETKIAQVRKALEDYERDVQPAALRVWEKRAIKDPSIPDSIQKILLLPLEKRDEPQRTALLKYFRSIDPEHARLKSMVPVGDEVGNNRPLPPSDKAMVIQESNPPRRSFIQKKGNFLSQGPEVEPGTPGFLPPLKPRGSRADRLDLAGWVMAPGHPLTSRVAVNQIWQSLFGQALAPTADNLGMKGEAPLHLDLIDWLASELISGKWKRKEIVRLIVKSATYRQESRRRTDLESRDPNNTWLTRQNRLRVEAELVRDFALSAAGVLSSEIGGPGFQPPLPLSMTSSKELKNERFMEQSPASHRYRRGLYVNVQRTLPFPMLKTFDAADANVSCSRRDRSNTPLQALTLLNDPVFWETSRLLADRVIREHPSATSDEKIARLFEWCLGRTAEAGEIEILRPLLRVDHRPADGEQTQETGQWTAIARAILNLDEFITRE